MTSELIPLALNELLDRPSIVSFNSALAFLILVACDSAILFSRSVSNAGITGEREPSKIKAKLFASPVDPIVRRERVAKPSAPSLSQVSRFLSTWMLTTGAF